MKKIFIAGCFAALVLLFIGFTNKTQFNIDKTHSPQTTNSADKHKQENLTSKLFNQLVNDIKNSKETQEDVKYHYIENIDPAYKTEQTEEEISASKENNLISLFQPYKMDKKPTVISFLKEEKSNIYIIKNEIEKQKNKSPTQEDINISLYKLAYSNNISNKPKQKAKLNTKELFKPSQIALDYIKYKKNIPTKEELNELSAIYSIPENLFYSLMLKESNGVINARSHKNARGLFQFLPETARQFGLTVNKKTDERLDPWKSAEASARYLAWIFTYLHPEKDRTKIDNYKYTLAAYNAGIGNVKNKNTLKIPNFKETVDYVNFITGHAKGELYIIQPGDILNKISRDNNISVEKIKELNNNINDKKLIAGKYLRIKDKSLNYKYYTVKRGDSLFKISKTHNIKMHQLANFNNIDIYSNILIGQKIKIPHF